MVKEDNCPRGRNNIGEKGVRGTILTDGAKVPLLSVLSRKERGG